MSTDDDGSFLNFSSCFFNQEIGGDSVYIEFVGEFIGLFALDSRDGYLKFFAIVFDVGGDEFAGCAFAV